MSIKSTTSSPDTLRVYHVTSLEAAKAIHKEGFQHPPLREWECDGEKEEAARLGVSTRPIFTSPRPITWECYGGAEVAVVIEVDTSSYYTTYPGDSGWRNAKKLYGKSFPVNLTSLGEVHLWEGVTRYRIVGYIDLSKVDIPPVEEIFVYYESPPYDVVDLNDLVVLKNGAGWAVAHPIPLEEKQEGWFVVESYPEYGWEIAENLP